MNCEPLVSICCLVYNHESFLRDCFNGFITQQITFPIEILVHDDASSDNSAGVIKEYTDKYPDLFKPIYQSENQYSKGVDVFQLNAQRAIGKYIAICEGDDYWTDPNKLQMQVDFLESHPDYSMCFHGAEIKYEDKNLYTEALCETVQDKEYTADELLNQWIVPTASIVMKRECAFYPIKGRERVFYGDYFIVFSCLALGKVRGFSQSMSTYRVNASSVMHNPKYKRNTLLKLADNWECFKENFPFASSKEVNKRLAFHYWQRASVQPTMRQSLQDRKKAFCTAPLVAFLMIFRPAVMAVVSLTSTFINPQKTTRLIKKITGRI